MTHEDQMKNFQAYHRAESFRQFMSDTNDRLRMLEGKGYTRDQGIEMLKLYALLAVVDGMNN